MNLFTKLLDLDVNKITLKVVAVSAMFFAGFYPAYTQAQVQPVNQVTVVAQQVETINLGK